MLLLKKLRKHQPLCAELRKMWEMECVVVPVIIGGLGAVSKKMGDHLAILPGCPKGFMCQMIANFAGCSETEFDSMTRDKDLLND